MNKTNITWADYTWNPITGCTNGCEYCYARKVTQRWPELYPSGFKPTCWPNRLDEPKRKKGGAIIFVGSMGDLFDPQLPAAFVDKVFETMLACRQHQFMLLTKRYERVNETVEHFVENREDSIRDDAFNHIHFGFTATNHDEIETGIINFGFDFISLEPLLDDVCLSEIGTGNGYTPQFNPIKKMKLVVAGGINPGKPLHEAHPEWLDRIIDDCNSLGVPLHYKHQGKNPEFNGKTYNAMIDGRVGK